MVEPRLTRIYYTTAQSSYLPRRSIPLSKSQHHKKLTLLRFHKGFPAKANSGKFKKFFKKTDNAPRKKFLLPTPGTVQVGMLLSASLHIHSQRRRVWKEEEKKHLTPALGQEWEEGNVFFPDAFSVFCIRW